MRLTEEQKKQIDYYYNKGFNLKKITRHFSGITYRMVCYYVHKKNEQK